MRGPLSVRVWAPGADKHLDVSDLSFSKTAPGGHATASVRFPAWVTSADPVLVPLARVKVYDTRHGGTVWGAGFLEMPGRTVGADGQEWDAGVVGPTALLADKAYAYHIVDSTFDDWEKRFSTNSGMSAEVTGHPLDEDKDCLLLQWPGGIPVGPSSPSRVSMRYTRLVEAGQRLGGIWMRHEDGINTANNKLQVVVSTKGVTGTNETCIDEDWKITGDVLTKRSGNSGFNVTAAGPNMLTIRSVRVGSAGNTTAGDDFNANFAAVTEVSVRALRRDRVGNVISGLGSYTGPIYAGDIVEDALWRFTELIDTYGADIQLGTHDIDQFAYADAVRFVDILGDLGLLEPDLFYYVGGSDDGTGLHSFRFGQWKSVPRYEADTTDGWSQPGGESDLCNRITVTWTDRSGRTQSTRTSIAVPVLDALGRTRDAEPVEVGFELGSEAAAIRIGQRVLADAADPPKSGTLTVARPIRDMESGRMVLPHEIEPGERVRIRDLDLTLRCTEMSYQDSDQSATLALGSPPLTADQLLARIERRRNRRKR